MTLQTAKLELGAATKLSRFRHESTASDPATITVTTIGMALMAYRIKLLPGNHRNRMTMEPSYMCDRRMAYGSTGAQLDMLWHAIDADETLKAQFADSTITARLSKTIPSLRSNP